MTEQRRIKGAAARGEVGEEVAEWGELAGGEAGADLAGEAETAVVAATDEDAAGPAGAATLA